MTTIHNKNTFRDYQEDADNAIYGELHTNNQRKCIVKMFCGSGKSILMQKCKLVEHLKTEDLLVYVFPSLSLIDQFYKEYLEDIPIENVLRICSEKDSDKDAKRITTDSKTIARFLEKQTKRIFRPLSLLRIQYVTVINT
jgi:predicted helicase